MAANPPSRRPLRFRDPDACVEAALAKIGRRVVLGTPLGLGKANHLVNSFYRRAEADPAIDLRIVTALTLARPVPGSELERRLAGPLVERLFGDYPELAYVEPMRRGTLPANVRVTEFYFQPAAFLGSPAAQRDYASVNYTHVVRDLIDAGINVLAQLVAAQGDGDGERFSLSSNPDLTLDLLPALERAERAGRPVARLAQVHRDLPFFAGDAEVPSAAFDFVLDDPACSGFTLPGPPNEPVSTAEHWIGLHASALIRDGGTLQLGIGSLGDAITAAIQLRDLDNAAWREVLGAAGSLDAFAAEIAAIGGTGRFERGLYGASEMLVDGFLDLYRTGILGRQVYPHPVVQRLADAGRIGEEVTPATLDALVEAGVVAERLGAADVGLLVRLGVLRRGVRWAEGGLELPGGERLGGDLADPAVRAAIAERALGERLAGHLMHSGFLLGPHAFYRALREMPPEERARIGMTAISFVNQLYGDEELKRAQRRHARFLNAGMKVTLLGAAAADALADERVVSGVGGQYNFVAMAHELAGARSVLMFPSTHEGRGGVESNVVWTYGHTTIPRHLRDLVVTEYGIADLRGKTDGECAAAMLQLADSRFQDGLLAEARRAGKLPAGHRIPDRFRANRPQRLEALLAPHRARGLFPELPYGSDLTVEELTLAKALRELERRLTRDRRALLAARPWRRTLGSPPAAAEPYLERMGLAAPRGVKERAMRRAVLFALSLVGAI